MIFEQTSGERSQSTEEILRRRSFYLVKGWPPYARKRNMTRNWSSCCFVVQFLLSRSRERSRHGLHRLNSVYSVRPFRAVFTWMNKNYWFCIITLYDWQKNSPHLFIQSEVKPKPIVTLLHTFSRALHQPNIILIGSFIIYRVLIGSLDFLCPLSKIYYFGFFVYDTQFKTAFTPM